MKRFQICVTGTVYLQVNAEDEDKAQAMIEAAIAGEKVQVDIMENELNAIKAIEKLRDTEINVYEVSET